MELKRFYMAKQPEIDALLDGGLEKLVPWDAPRRSFREALLRGASDGLPAVIAEYKRASPSRGVICENLGPEDVARQYAENGASAISVLTEEQYFHGSLSFLERIAACMDGGPEESRAAPIPPTPMLRKDFIFHPAQVAATIATPASAMLLIVRLTPDARLLRRLREQAEGAGIQAVVEVFGERDLMLARESGATVIQVNARDLETLKVDREACLRLSEAFPPQDGELWIAASGMNSRSDLEAAASAGYHAALVGSALMEHGTPGASLRAMLVGGAA